MTASNLLHMAREGDGRFSVTGARVIFTHVDGRCWTMTFGGPGEARGWLALATS